MPTGLEQRKNADILSHFPVLCGLLPRNVIPSAGVCGAKNSKDISANKCLKNDGRCIGKNPIFSIFACLISDWLRILSIKYENKCKTDEKHFPLIA